MKKIWTAILLFLLVFIVECLCRKYTLIWAECMSLFLFTPDYFARVFSLPFPIFHLIKSFLLQFFGIHPLGPLTISLLITGLYLLICRLFRAVGVGKGKIFHTVFAGAVFAAVAISATIPSSRKQESLCRVLVDTYNRDWNAVLAAASPKKCEKQRELLPFALLALQNKGSLTVRLFEYPVKQLPDMDYQGSDLCIGGFFDAMLAESLNIQNEVMHGVFQLNSERPYGTCFMSLHLLIRCALTQKNYKLAEKYTKVLGRSPRYAYEAKKILPYCYGESLPLPVSNTSGKALLVDKNPISLLLMLSYTDLASKRSRDRFIAYQLLDQRFNNE